MTSRLKDSPKDETHIIVDPEEEDTISALVKGLEEYKAGQYKSFENADELIEHLRKWSLFYDFHTHYFRSFWKKI